MSPAPVTLGLSLAGTLLLGVAVTAWRRREAPGADLFAAAAGVAGAGVLAIAASVAAASRPVTVALAICLGLVFPIPWLLFSLRYTGREDPTSATGGAVVAAPPCLGLLATSAILGSQLVPWLSLPSREAAAGLAAVGVVLLTLVQWVALLFAGGLVLIASGLLLWTFYRYEYLDPATGALAGTFGTLPWLSLLFGFQVASANPLALPRMALAGFAVGGLAGAAALGPYRLFERDPAAGNVGPRRVFADLEDAVIVTDSRGTIVKLNAAAEATLDAAGSDLVGTGIADVLEAAFTDLREGDTVAVRTTSGRRLFEPVVSGLSDRHGHDLGYAVVLRDVTDRTTRQQRLEVLNRVLRHNLRTDVNVVVGHAEWLHERSDDRTVTDRTGAILDAAWDLADLSEEARGIDQLLGNLDTTPRDLPLESLVRTVLEDAAADDRATCHCDVPGDVVVRASAELLEVALAQLVENAVEHNDSTDPYVGIVADYDPDRTYPLHVSVLDDGPGIPEHEGRALQGETETALEHGSGFGLWVVRWTVARLGGELDHGRRDPRGSTVSVRLPRARRDGAERPRG